MKTITKRDWNNDYLVTITYSTGVETYIVNTYEEALAI